MNNSSSTAFPLSFFFFFALKKKKKKKKKNPLKAKEMRSDDVVPTLCLCLCFFVLINVSQREYAFNGFLDFHFFRGPPGILSVYEV